MPAVVVILRSDACQRGLEIHPPPPRIYTKDRETDQVVHKGRWNCGKKKLKEELGFKDQGGGQAGSRRA